MRFERRLVGCVLIVAASCASSGCLITAIGALSGLTARAEAEVDRCKVQDDGSSHDCDIRIESGSDGIESYEGDSTVEFTDGISKAILDPIVLEVAAGTQGISGTFTNSAGQSGSLIVYPALPFVPVDDTRTLRAGPGKELVILDLPTPLPTLGVPYRFDVDFSRLVSPGTSTDVKMLATGKVTRGTKTFYVPVFPCTSDVAALPTIALSFSTVPRPIDLPFEDATGCDHELYRFERAAQICDLDNDADVDERDLDIVAARTGTASPGDPRDIDRDGAFTANDVGQCRTQCTRAQCATEPTTPLTYLLAEGSTGSFFDTDLLLANPTLNFAPITLRYLNAAGVAIEQERTLLPMSRTTLRLDEVAGLENAEFSTLVTSTAGVPIVVERTMHWDATGYGAHTEKATSAAAPTWYFAEGSQGFFFTYFLLVNPQATANTAHVTYFREGAPPVVRDYPLLPSSRRTIDAGAERALIDTSFGARIDFDQPGVAERAMYFGTSPLFTGGHGAVGVTAPSTEWFLAEGATGSFFTTFVLLANPSDQDAHVTLTYLPQSGSPIVKRTTVPARQRMTRNIADEDPLLASAAMGVRVESDQPIVVERAQYWPNPVATWAEAHDSFGVNETATRWGLAEGRVGGAASYQTYILLANPGSQPADVDVTFLRTTGGIVPKRFRVPPGGRVNVAVTGPGSSAPELVDETFGALIESTQPIAVERSVYSNATGVTWASGTNATATRLPEP